LPQAQELSRRKSIPAPQAFSHCVGRKLPLRFPGKAREEQEGSRLSLESGLKNSYKGK